MATRKTAKKISARKKTRKQDSIENDLLMSESSKSASLKSFKFNKSYIIFGIVILLVAGMMYVVRNFLIVSTVNGQPITRLELIQELEKQQGQKTLANLKTKVLILQEAKKQNITVSQKDVDDEVKKIEEILKNQGQKLNDVLASQQKSKELFLEQVKFQVMIKRLVGKDVKVTDKDISDYIDTNKNSFPEGTKIDDKLKETVKQQLEQQKLDQRVQTWIDELQKKAKIVDYVKFQ